MWQTPAELHSALNDLPVILLIASVAFDLLGSATKRDSLKAAGFWTIVGAGIGALVALITGLRAEDSIEHGGSVHLVMERHQTLAISATVLIIALAAWRIWRKGQLRSQERPVYLTITSVGALAIIWVAHLGGTIVYRYGGGIPTPVIEAALEERAGGHTHGPGEEHGHDEAAPSAGTNAADSSAGGETHAHPRDTPAHEHE
jgi:uncharacterized membrane protein